MKFKVDENLPGEVKAILISNGHDAHTVYDENLAGAPDSSIAKVCLSEKRAIITLDKDFSDIRTYPPSLHSGIIVLRLKRTDKNTVINKIESIQESLKEDVSGKLWIVEDDRIRIRD